jgi:hypothetical protein
MYVFASESRVIKLLPTLLLDDVLSATEGINGSDEAESGVISVVVVVVNDLINVLYEIIAIDDRALS